MRPTGALGQVPRSREGKAPARPASRPRRLRHKRLRPAFRGSPHLFRVAACRALAPRPEGAGAAGELRPPDRKEKHAPALFFSPPGWSRSKRRRLARRPAETSALPSGCRRIAPGGRNPCGRPGREKAAAVLRPGRAYAGGDAHRPLGRTVAGARRPAAGGLRLTHGPGAGHAGGAGPLSERGTGLAPHGGSTPARPDGARPSPAGMPGFARSRLPVAGPAVRCLLRGAAHGRAARYPLPAAQDRAHQQRDGE
jgi:hypothetical protein